MLQLLPILAEHERAEALATPAAFLAEHPTLMKRPVLENGGGVVVGFDEASWTAALGAGR